MIHNQDNQFNFDTSDNLLESQMHQGEHVEMTPSTGAVQSSALSRHSLLQRGRSSILSREQQLKSIIAGRVNKIKPLEYIEEEDSAGLLLEEECMIKFERDQMNARRSWSNLFWSIFNYILSSVAKNQRSFNIGVFTVFLTVTFLCATKSLFDVSPVALIKFSQDNVGVFDF